MAHFAGGGPFARTCGECKHKGYRRESSREHWDPGLQQMVCRTYKFGGCAMFKKLTGEHGPIIKSDYEACKYFEALGS